MRKLTLHKLFKHFFLVNKHRALVFKFSCFAGIPFRGLVHDLSKYSKEEFFESAAYYIGNGSPITECKNDIGYSLAWLHHKGRNKHHFEYWYDQDVLEENMPLIPFNIFCEMVCDMLSAGISYNGKNWNTSTQINYWNRNNKNIKMNSKIRDCFTEVFEQVARNGIYQTIKRKNLKNIYTNKVI